MSKTPIGERLVVAVDYSLLKYGGIIGARRKVLDLEAKRHWSIFKNKLHSSSIWLRIDR